MNRRSAVIGSPAALSCLVGWILCAAAVTLYPFDFAPARVNALDVMSPGRALDPAGISLNVALFVPIGLLLSQIAERYTSGWAVYAVTAASGLLLAGAVEWMQQYLPLRDPSAVDMLSNAGGALLGAVAQRHWRSPTALLRRVWTRPVLMRGVLGYTVLALLASGALQLRTRLSGWSRDYPLLIGNEETGDRPWRGRVFSFELTDAATPEDALRRFAAGSPLIASGQRVAAVELHGSAPYHDRTGHLPDLDLAPPVQGGPGGAGEPRHRWLRTEGAVPTLVSRLQRTNAFTLRIRCATSDVHQGGPARIISNSADPYHRNFTLGQEGGDLTFRLRTPHTGENGTRPEALIRNVFADTHPKEIVVSYDGATLRSAVTGVGRVTRMDLTPGSSLVALYRQVSAEELPVQSVSYVAMLFVVPGLLIGAMSQTAARRLALCAAWAVVFTVALEVTLGLVTGRPVDRSDLAWTVSVGAVMVTLAAVTVATVTTGHDARD